MAQRKGGIIFLKIDGVLRQAKGAFSYSLMTSQKEAIVGADSVHGYKETPVAPYIEGEITDATDLDVKALLAITDSTVTLELANGKVIALRGAWFAGDGVTSTDEGNIAVRFEGLTAEEIR